ncbi:hypothetical protein [Azospirillum argentinense]|uniref:hypothetical protein n=1 Tax=Azospirillum argentinense TaxID=2970906 RepID=UPI0032DE770F
MQTNDLHVIALGHGFTMIRLNTKEGRAHVEKLATSRAGFQADTYTSAVSEAVAIAAAATDAGLRVRFN